MRIHWPAVRSRAEQEMPPASRLWTSGRPAEDNRRCGYWRVAVREPLPGAPGLSDLGFDRGCLVGREPLTVVAFGREPAGEPLFEDLRTQEHEIAESPEAALMVLVILTQ
jgi:hypothetical protein